jgi:hypothetical protein
MKKTWLVLVVALVLMASGSQSSRPDPATPPDEYRQQVATSIRDLTSGHRPRNPQMSGVGTGRLILEGVVENLRIYRMHQEEKACEAKKKGDKEKRRKERGHRHRLSRHDGDSDKRRRGERHGSANGCDGHRRRHRRRRSADGEKELRRGHRSGSRQELGDRSVHNDRDHGDQDKQQQRRDRSGSGEGSQQNRGGHLMPRTLPVGAAVAVKVEEAVEERLFGPKGTPFGHLPTRGKGVGFLTHAKTTYQHIKAEQDAGHRRKGAAEKMIHDWMEKRRNAKSAANGTIEEEELLIEKNKLSHGCRSGRHGDRRKRHRSRSRGDNGDTGRGGRPVFVPVVEREESPRGGRGNGRLTELRRSFEQPAPSVRQPTVSRTPSRPNSSYDRDIAPGPEPWEFQTNTGPERASSVRINTLAPTASVRSYEVPAPSVRGAPSVTEVGKDSARGSRSGSRVPTIRVQSPTPPEQATSVRSLTPCVREIPSRVHSPESRPQGPASLVWSSAPSQHAAQPHLMPATPPVAATPYRTVTSVVDMPASVVPVAPPMLPPPPPPPPATVSRPAVNPGQDALLASIQVGVTLERVSDENKKDASAARKDEARIEDMPRETPVYEETPHSHDVEALEHAQAVEERERRQDEERVTRSKTRFIAPRPKPNLPVNFQDELAAKLGKIKLNKPSIDGASGDAPSEPLNVVKPRPSNETWRTVYSDHEPYSEPDQAFRERLGSALSARGTTRPPTAATTPVAAPAREVTPNPDAILNLSANIAEPGWSFDNVPRDDCRKNSDNVR